MLRFISNVFNGMYAHWNDNNTETLNSLLMKIEEIESRTNGIILYYFLDGLNSICSFYFGPKRDKSYLPNVTNREIKSLTKTDFFNFYDTGLKLFCTALLHTSPSLSTQLWEDYKKLMNSDSEFEKIDPKSIDSDFIKSTMSQGSRQLLQSMPIIKFNELTSDSVMINFKAQMFVMSVYVEYTKIIKKEINQ